MGRKRRKNYSLEIRVRIKEEKVDGVIQEDLRTFIIPGEVYQLASGRYEIADERERLAIDRLNRILDCDLIEYVCGGLYQQNVNSHLPLDEDDDS